MSKRKPMGSGASDLFKGTGADALAEATGAKPKAGKAKAPRAAAAARPGPVERQPGASYLVTTVRLRNDQWHALRMAAQDRALKEGGKADASQILRDLIDQWMGQ